MNCTILDFLSSKMKINLEMRDLVMKDRVL